MNENQKITNQSKISLQQELNSVATVNYNKCLSSMKQTTQIRKITLQTLSPIIKKMQDHISYLLEQSTKMRKQTKLLEQVSSTNKQYKSQIQNLNKQIFQCHSQLSKNTQNQKIINSQYEKKILYLQMSNDELKRQSQQNKQKIKKLIEMSQSQNQLFNLNKSNVKQNIENLNKQIQQFYIKSINSKNFMENQINDFLIYLKSNTKQFNFLDQEFQKVKKIANLYSTQREQIRNKLAQFVQLKIFAIQREQYQKDKKTQKVQNQMNKKQIQKMLNEALTPQIRSFLPNLIQNIELLNKLNRQIKNCNEQIRQFKQVEIKSKNKIESIQKNIQFVIEQVNRQITKNQNKFELKIKQLTKQLQKSNQSIQQLHKWLERIKKQTENQFENFIQKNKNQIYSVMLTCQPVQTQEQDKRIKQIVFGFQQKIKQIQVQLIQRCDNVLNIGKNLQAKLQLFQNRITKNKSDMKVQNDNMKLLLDNINLKMTQSQKKNYQQSQMFSKIIQIILILNSIMIDQNYLKTSEIQNQNKQDYITFNDGFILQINNLSNSNQSQVQYRKKIMNKQILKRTTLKQSTKLIDFVISNFKNWKWTEQKERPSQFFNQFIYPTYLQIFNDKKQIIQAKKSFISKENKNQPKLQNTKFISGRKSKDSFLPKKSLSKLQDFNHQNSSIFEQKNTSLIFGSKSNDKKDKLQNLYQTIDFKKPNRIQLKKIDHEQKQITRKRYSSIKH